MVKNVFKAQLKDMKDEIDYDKDLEVEKKSKKLTY